MEVNFHIVLAKSFLEKIGDLQTFCNDFGFEVSFNSENLQKKLSKKPFTLNIKYRNKITSPQIRLTTISDVKDICDDICNHLKEEYDIAIAVDFNGNNVAAAYIVVAVLTKMSKGILYIEQDGSILSGDQAIKEAKAWDDVK